MSTRMKLIAACLMMSAVTFGSLGMESKAQTIEVPLAGLQAKIAQSQAAAVPVNQNKETEEAESKNPYNNLAIAQINEDTFVNIRNQPDAEEGEVRGKMYNNSAAEITGEENGWYQVRSGSVEGYIKKEYFVTGTEAEELAQQVGRKVATVKAEALMVRDGAGTDKNVVGMVGNSEKLSIVEEQDDWVKVSVDTDMEGYVSKDYVDCSVSFREAESLEEEAQRLAQEEAANQAALEEARLADEASKTQEDQAVLDAKAQAEAAAKEAAEAWEEAQRLAQEQAAADQAAKEALDEQAIADTKTQAEAAAKEAAEAQEEAQRLAAEQAAAEEVARQEAIKQQQNQQDQNQTQQTEAQKPETEIEQPDTNVDQGTGTQPEIPETETGSSGSQDPSGNGSQDNGTSGTRQSIVSFALSFQGNPYVWGGTSLTNGADCSGFTQSVMANFGISIPRVASDQAYGGRSVDLGSIQPGDLIFYLDDTGVIGHVGMYIGNNQMVHASTPESGIIVSDIGYRQAYSAASYIS